MRRTPSVVNAAGVEAQPAGSIMAVATKSAVDKPSVEPPTIDTTIATKITSRAELDQLVAGLRDKATDWLAVPLARMIAYVQSMIEGVAVVAPRMVAAAVEAKGMEPGDPRAAEDWPSLRSW